MASRRSASRPCAHPDQQPCRPGGWRGHRGEREQFTSHLGVCAFACGDGPNPATGRWTSLCRECALPKHCERCHAIITNAPSNRVEGGLGNAARAKADSPHGACAGHHSGPQCIGTQLGQAARQGHTMKRAPRGLRREGPFPLCPESQPTDGADRATAFCRGVNVLHTANGAHPVAVQTWPPTPLCAPRAWSSPAQRPSASSWMTSMRSWTASAAESCTGGVCS